MKKWQVKTLIFLFLYIIVFQTQASQKNIPKDIKIKKIWDSAEHNAFTDLIKFNGYYYCSFREGSVHFTGSNGVIRILKSKDAENWESVALLKKQGIDLRDPKLSVTPDGRIMVIIGGSIYQEDKLLGREPQVSFSDKSGKNFLPPEKVTIDPEISSWGDWIWRVTWHNGIGYAIDYQVSPLELKGPATIYLVKTTDGKKFDKISKLNVDGFPNESTIRFDKKGIMYVLIRRELDDKMGIWAHSEAPYSQWIFKKLDFCLGGPNFIFLTNKKIVVGARRYGSEVYTCLYVGTKDGNFKEAIHLPSGKDNSYPGLVLEKKQLLVSYYSSHEGKASIYIAKVPLGDL